MKENNLNQLATLLHRLFEGIDNFFRHNAVNNNQYCIIDSSTLFNTFRGLEKKSCRNDYQSILKKDIKNWSSYELETIKNFVNYLDRSSEAVVKFFYHPSSGAATEMIHQLSLTPDEKNLVRNIADKLLKLNSNLEKPVASINRGNH